MKFLIKVVFPLIFLFPLFSSGAELHRDITETLRAKATLIISEEIVEIPGTDTKGVLQEIELKILDGERKGELIKAQNDFLKLEIGDVVFVNHIETIEGINLYSVLEPDRRLGLLILFIIFSSIVIYFGGKEGFRSLITLLLSILLIAYVFLPSILNNLASPLLLSMVFGISLLAFSMYGTHGFNKKTSIAFFGATISILITGFLAAVLVPALNLSGFSSDEAVILNFSERGAIDMAGLLLGAIIIGVIGVLDDVTITQSSAVFELKDANNNLSMKELYKRGTQIGKDHVGALINTLALAYIGVALPLLLLFSLSETSAFILVNREIFATEIVRMLIGSIGLTLAVPITTFLAALIATKRS